MKLIVLCAVVSLFTSPALAQNAQNTILRNLNNVRICDQFSGKDAGEKIRACIGDLPAEGGTADARGLESAQEWTACPFTEARKSVTVQIGAGTHTSRVNCTVPANVTLDFSRGGILSMAPSTTITVNGHTSGTLSQHFAGAGSFVLNAVERIPVHWCGANGTDGADDTAALQMCFRLAMASGQSTGSGSVSLSKPKLYFPEGIYDVAADIGNGASQVTGLEIVGDNAIVRLAAGVTFLSNVGYMFSMTGMTIRGGAGVIEISTANLDSAMITIDRSEFHNWTGAAIMVDNNSGSTQLVVKNSKFMNSEPTGQVLKALNGLFARFVDCWVEVAPQAVAAFEVTNTALTIEGLVGVPFGQPPRPGIFAWIDTAGPYGGLYITNSRFGAEGAGAADSIVINRSSATIAYPAFPNSVVIKDSDLYASGTLLHLYAIPNIVDITGVRGLVDTLPIKVESRVGLADLAAIGNLNNSFRVEYNHADYGVFINPDGAPVIAREGLPLVADRSLVSSRPDLADLVYQSQGSTGAHGPTYSQTNVTRTSLNDEFGVPTIQWSATAADGSAIANYKTALNGLAPGVYTVMFDIEVMTNTTIRPVFAASNTTTRKFTLARGKHSVAIPFYFYTGASQTISFAAYGLPDGAVIQWQRWRIYRGRRVIPGPRVELECTAAPVANQYYRGDRCYNTNRTAAGTPDYWEASVSGSPGTWAANKKRGTFTASKTATTTVRDVEVRASSIITLMPTNAAAATLMGGATHPYISARNEAASFAITTANGAEAAGTETFEYLITN